MTDRVIRPTAVNGDFFAPISKSDAIRKIICATLADAPTLIGGIVTADRLPDDVAATLRVATAMGASIQTTDDGLRLCPSKIGAVNGGVCLDCGGSASLLRFILPVAAATGKEIIVDGDESLRKRPIRQLLRLMSEHGCRLDGETLPLKCSGRLEGGGFSVEGNVSSQFVSGLLLALPLTNDGGTVSLLSPLRSSGYVDMTMVVMKEFGVAVNRSSDNPAEYTLEGGQKYISPRKTEIEGDWSGAAFMMCAAAANGAVHCHGLDRSSRQPDSVIVELLRRAGASVTVDGDTVSVESGILRAFDADVSQCPDIAPAIAVTMAAAVGRSRIVNAGGLRFKESDRLYGIARVLSELGGDASVDGDTITINGTGGLHGGKTDGAGDHRLVMCAAAASVICRDKVTVEGSECVGKSYPTFFEELDTH